MLASGFQVRHFIQDGYVQVVTIGGNKFYSCLMLAGWIGYFIVCCSLVGGRIVLSASLVSVSMVTRVSPKIKTSSNLDLGLEIDNSDIN